MLRMGLTIIQLFAALAIIALVLLQRGKGADAGAGFGAGASGTVFGARGARTALSRATAIFAAIFMVNSLALAYMGNREAETRPKTLLDEAAGVPAPGSCAVDCTRQQYSGSGHGRCACDAGTFCSSYFSFSGGSSSGGSVTAERSPGSGDEHAEPRGAEIASILPARYAPQAAEAPSR